ncbi:MAG: hypothetical protein ACI8UR_000354 [Natronomonas sp.]|jgi:hypothetical protein|uniref:hypothetical protein n=1 Tax=Natronomonas sp. TaxID=2184060 RepID=UPI0039892398
MQSPDTTDAPLVPQITDRPEEQTDIEVTDRCSSERPFERPPQTDYATEYTQAEEEIEPFVADLR